MDWIESLIYGLISGLSEFMPISSSAHQQILMHLFGIDSRDPVRDLFIHIAMLIAVSTACRSFLDAVKHEVVSVNSRRHIIRQNSRYFYDWRLIRGAIFPMLTIMLLLRYVLNLQDNLLLTLLLLAINGLILFLPERMVQGNKDARIMSAFDSILIGCSGAISVFDGISRIGCTYGVSVARGSSKKHALTWSFVLSVFALAFLSVFDLISIISAGVSNFWGNLYTYVLSGITAYLGGYAGITVMRYIAVRPGNNGFAYYCWGASLFSFIMYLTVS